ncbi:MAG: hypothetical protein ACOC1F_02720, partial [Myxococcota bacterium]
LFLTRLPPHAMAGPTAPGGPPAGLGEVQIVFPEPDDPSEVWTLRDANGMQVCQLPCTTRVPRVSGYSLRREQPLAEIPLPARLSLSPGSTAVASYRAQRGSPLLSKLNFYFVGLPTAGVAIGFGIWGASQHGDTCEDPRGEPEECFPGSGFLFGTAAMMASIAGASYWWFAYSHDAELSLSTQRSGSTAVPSPTIVFGPGGLYGSF